MKTLKSQRQAGKWKESRAAGLPALVCQTTEPQATAGSLRGHCHQHLGPRLRLHEASFLVVSGPRVPPWVKATDILFCLGPCPAPFHWGHCGIVLDISWPWSVGFLWGGCDSQPHFYKGQGAQGKEPRAKKLLALPKGTLRELDIDLDPLTLTPRIPRPEEGQEKE